MAIERESTTSTVIGDMLAAIAADSAVPDMSEEMCTEITASAPPAAAASYASRNCCGDGREVLNGTNLRSAAATSAVVTSTPSLNCFPASTTCSGTTRMPWLATSSWGRYAVESVTMATLTCAGYRLNEPGLGQLATMLT